jgi:hypothetical protein
MLTQAMIGRVLFDDASNVSNMLFFFVPRLTPNTSNAFVLLHRIGSVAALVVIGDLLLFHCLTFKEVAPKYQKIITKFPLSYFAA